MHDERRGLEHHPQACAGIIDPEVFRANLTPEDLADTKAAAIPVETLRAYAKSMSRQLEDAPIRTPIVSPGSSGLPYSEPDDRRHCRTCQNQRGGYCRALRPGRRVAVVDDIPRRCLEYSPLPHDPDSRTGRERWPTLIEAPASED